MTLRTVGVGADEGPPGTPQAETSPPVPVWQRTRAWNAAAFRVARMLVGGGFVAALRELERAQWLSGEELRARTEARLGPLLRHAAENVPFYRDAYRRLGLAPDELRTSIDLTRLPIVSKAVYREHFPDQFRAANVPRYRCLRRWTSGSTGAPFPICLDRQALPRIFASHLFYDSWFDLFPFDRYVRIVAPNAPEPPLPADTPVTVRLRQSAMARLQVLYEAWTQKQIPVGQVDGEGAEIVYRGIEAFRPAFVLGYSSALATLADQLLRLGLRLSRPIRGVIVIAELLTPLRRRLIEAYFQAPIVNRYGLRELGSWSAQSCRETPEQFHVNSELVVWESVREDGTPAAPGETGRIVLTDLHNYANPVIRYDTGDLAVVRSVPCACGRGFPLVGPIEGRSQEYLRTPSGKVIRPAMLERYFFGQDAPLDEVRHYQLLQGALGRVRLQIVPGPSFNARSDARLVSDLAQLFGEEAITTIETVTTIPAEKSGKRPVIKICNKQ
jgi:phenylacetate-CoA ligase